MTSLAEARQFYGRQLALVAVGVALFLAVLYMGWGELTSIPRDAFEALFTAFATLLGLTFTAFALLMTFRGLPSDFLVSKTYSSMGNTFVGTLAAELCALFLTGTAFLAYGAPWAKWVGLAGVLFAFVALALTIEWLDYMSFLFAVARRKGTGP